MQPVSAENAEHFCQLLNSPFPATKLCLAEHHLSLEDAQQISKAIKQTTTLQYLFIINCHLTEFSLLEIVNALKENRSIIYLDLWSNQIGDKGALLLKDLLKMNNTICTLNISNNFITRVGAQYLADALDMSNNLTSLFIEHNFEADVPEVFLRPMKHNRILRTLKLNSREEDDDAWYNHRDMITIRSFLKENRQLPSTLADTMLRHHGLRFGFRRQKLILLGSAMSGKSLLWRNLTNAYPVNEQELDYKPTKGLGFYTATTLTGMPFMETLKETCASNERYEGPDMLMEAVLRLVNKVLDIEFYKRNDPKFRESYIQRQTRNTFAPTMARTIPSVRTRRSEIVTTKKVSTKIKQKPKNVVQEDNNILFEFQKIALKFSKRKVRDVEQDVLQHKQKTEFAKKQVKDKMMAEVITGKVNVRKHILEYEKRLKQAENKPAGSTPLVRKESETLVPRKIPKPKPMKMTRNNNYGSNSKDIAPLRSQSDFNDSWLLQRRTYKRALNYTCVELAGDVSFRSLSKTIFPTPVFGMYIICFNMSDIDTNALLLDDIPETLKSVFYWLKLICQIQESSNLNDKEGFNKNKILLVGTHLDKLLEKNDSDNIILKTNTFIRRKFRKIREQHPTIQHDIFLRNSKENILFFCVDNISGVGILDVFKKIHYYSEKQYFVRKSVELREFSLFDYIRSQALFRESNQEDICLTLDVIKAQCTRRGISANRVNKLLTLFANSGLGYFCEKNQVVFRDFRIFTRLFDLVFFSKIDYLGRQINITLEELSKLNELTNQIIENDINPEICQRLSFSLLKWDRSGQYFIDVLKESLLVCSVNESFIPNDIFVKIERNNTFLDNEEENDDTDSMASGNEMDDQLHNEYVFLPKFLVRGKVRLGKNNRCHIKVDQDYGFSITSLYHNLLCVILPLLSEFCPTTDFHIYKNYAEIALREFHFYFIPLHSGFYITMHKDSLEHSYFVYKLIDTAIRIVQVRLKQIFSFSVLFEENRKFHSLDESEANKIEPWFSCVNYSDIEDAFDETDDLNPINLRTIYAENFENKDNNIYINTSRSLEEEH